MIAVVGKLHHTTLVLRMSSRKPTILEKGKLYMHSIENGRAKKDGSTIRACVSPIPNTSITFRIHMLVLSQFIGLLDHLYSTC